MPRFQKQNNQVKSQGLRQYGRVVPHLLRLALCALFALIHPLVASAGTPVTLYQSFAGNMDFVTTGATFRTSANSQCPDTTTNSATSAIAGISATASIEAAYLYWAGSTNTSGYVDSTVTFQGSTVTADRTFTETFPYSGTDYHFYSGFADVTSVVNATRNGNYTMSGLDIYTGSPHCDVSVVLGGWSMVVVYEDTANEPLRVINMWDGFQYFRASELVLSPTNFRVPSSGNPKDGKIGHLSWEGDDGNSGTSGGFAEELQFSNDGFTYSSLTNGVNLAGNQFNSTVSDLSTSQINTYGVDVDVYDISNLIAYDSTVANTRYASGNDLVILSAEIFSVTNTPVADLAITKSHSGDFTVSSNGTYTLGVSNNGPANHTGTVTVTDTLPSGLTILNATDATGSGWDCSSSTPPSDVSCTRSDTLNDGASYPDITLTVQVAAAAAPSVTNTATVTGALFDNVAGNDSDADLTTVLQPDLSASTKSVVDTNGGDADPDDTLRYTITVTESAGIAVTGVQVTDDIPMNVSGFTVTSIPGGATDASVIGGGANGNGFLDIQGISVPASGSVDIEFEVTINGGAPAGTDIDNTGTVSNPDGPGATPSAPTVTVSVSSIPSTGVKNLYLYDAAGFELSRAPPAITDTSVTLNKNGTVSYVWTQAAEPLAADLELGAGNFPVVLYLDRNNTNTRNRTVQVDVWSTSLGVLIGTATQTVGLTGALPPQEVTLTPSLGSSMTLPAGDIITVTVTNVTNGGGGRTFRLYPTSGTNHSRVELNANTVINVDSVDAYDADYVSGGSIPADFAPGDTAYLRAVISDPFGSVDIASASIEILDSGGSSVASGAMTEVNDSGADTKTYEYAYDIPGAGPDGNWTARVTGVEGTEGTVTDLGIGAFSVVSTSPDILLMKLNSVIDDPVNGASADAKAIPGANILYRIIATNQGAGAADTGTVVVTDAIPSDLELFVDDLGGAGSGPILLIDGSTASGLTVPLNFGGFADMTDEVEFDDGSGTYLHIPTSTGGYDANVRAIRVRPSGPFDGAASAPYPSFELRFRARVK